MALTMTAPLGSALSVRQSAPRAGMRISAFGNDPLSRHQLPYARLEMSEIPGICDCVWKHKFGTDARTAAHVSEV